MALPFKGWIIALTADSEKEAKLLKSSVEAFIKSCTKVAEKDFSEQMALYRANGANVR